MTDTLLPCPFCGHADPLLERDDSGFIDSWYVRCVDCYANSGISCQEKHENTDDDAKQRAIDLWNRRAKGMMQHIGDNVHRLRKLRQLSQAELAAEIGCSTRTVASIEQGSRYPSMPLLVKLCAVFDCNFGAIMDDQTQKEDI